MKRLLLLLALLSVCAANADDLEFPKLVKATLVFREENDEAAYYPHTIFVYLRLENQHDSDLNWVCNSARGIEAEVLDSAGHPVRSPESMASIPSQYYRYLLPFRSSMDWFISSGGISMRGDRKSNAALMVGTRGWLLPRDSLASYSLKIRVTGTPFSSSDKSRETKVLFDVPPTPIRIEK